ncbi:hypothetical protein [Kitasatospora sp. NPDC088351]
MEATGAGRGVRVRAVGRAVWHILGACQTVLELWMLLREAGLL